MHAVFKAAELPASVTNNAWKKPKASSDSANYATPPALVHLYGLPLDGGGLNVSATQAVFETAGQTYSPADLSTFREYFGLPPAAMTPLTDIGQRQRRDQGRFRSQTRCNTCF